ncbi:MAG: class I SAM-dependent methyltransferase [Crocinitomicaceae bacterium]|nr:class I SAM-dependent methyltransferase [Crocinitomicaceae bacterium]
MDKYNSTCELVNTYEILEHIMGIEGLHPHSLTTINNLFNVIAKHTKDQIGIILDIGCGSGSGTHKLAKKLSENVSVIGIDINESSINKAKSNYSEIDGLSFYHGTLEAFQKENSEMNIIGIIAVSVSMFLPNTIDFYRTSEEILSENGIFIDAPFVFKFSSVSEKLKHKTYSVCGCNMKMETTEHLKNNLQKLGFTNITAEEKEFELMDLKTLSKDYTIRQLLSNFRRKTFTLPAPLKGHTSWYILRRTLNIFAFFIRNRSQFGAAIIIGIKTVAKSK